MIKLDYINYFEKFIPSRKLLLCKSIITEKDLLNNSLTEQDVVFIKKYKLFI